MKKIFLIIAFILFYAALAFSQAPKSFKYQTVIRNASGEPISNQNVNLTIELLQGSPSGSVVCFESFGVTTNEFGLVNLEIGSQNPSEFSSIDWSGGPYFVRINLNGTVMGTTQLLSVPYALYAEQSGNAGGAGPWSVNGDNIYYSGGSVGIGTMNPMGTLDIRGTLRHGVTLYMSNEDESHELLLYSGSQFTPEAYICWHNTDPLCFQTGENGGYIEKMRITPEGNLGLGTSSPEAKLDIRGSYYDEGVALRIGSRDGLHFLNLFGGRENDPNPYIWWKSGDPLRFATDEGGWSEKMRITSDGKVGIGTANPPHALTVNVSGDNQGIRLIGNQIVGNTVAAGIYANNGGGSFNGITQPGDIALIYEGISIGEPKGFVIAPWSADISGIRINDVGYVGIGISNPSERLHILGDLIIDGGAKALRLKSGGVDHTYLEFYADSDNPDVRSGYIGYSSGGQVDLKILNQMGSGDIILDPGSGGTVSVPELTITGGSDLAEPFPIVQILEEGSVVIIDESNPGNLIISNKAYDKRVAGIVSGAGGVKPGLTLRQEGVMEGTQNIALTGRVYVKATAENGAIKPGDRLTTSSKPGHAMKATNQRYCDGAVIGKAMSSLVDGTGLVLVLVNLQ